MKRLTYRKGNITATFSEAMDVGTINSATMIVSEGSTLDDGALIISGTVTSAV
ncbi:MAG: hypothetical protein IPP40_16250 [bacterium]|nr:hypothetical protein [bacterium]